MNDTAICLNGNELRLPSATGPNRYPEPSWLASWRAQDPVPVSAAEVRRSLTAWRNALTPASGEEVMAALDSAIDLFGTPKGWARQAPMYRVLLGDLPADLLAVGMFRALRDCHWFPKPGEIRSPISDELARRQHVVRRLRAALTFAERQEGAR